MQKGVCWRKRGDLAEHSSSPTQIHSEESQMLKPHPTQMKKGNKTRPLILKVDTMIPHNPWATLQADM